MLHAEIRGDATSGLVNHLNQMGQREAQVLVSVEGAMRKAGCLARRRLGGGHSTRQHPT
jgi:hypothetical protein